MRLTEIMCLYIERLANRLLIIHELFVDTPGTYF